jgi:hypothetical protein
MPFCNFTPPAASFHHVHGDLLGPVPKSAGYKYCFTAVDRFTHRLEFVLIPDITGDTVTPAVLLGCLSRFGCPQTITSKQGRQFQSQLFHALAQLYSFQLSRTSATPL